MLGKIEKWGDMHHPKWFFVIRISLGLVLIWKGVEFALNLDAFTHLMLQTMFVASITISLLAHFIIVAHIAGGLLIALGSHTRAAALIQIPILLGAVFFVNASSSDIFRPYSEYWLSLTVLLALIFFVIEGDGPVSIEHQPEHH